MQLSGASPAKRESFTITSSADSIIIASESEIGLLYGAYHLVRLQDTHADTRNLSIIESPAYSLRILNHWDNLDGTVERGYAGHSIWRWDELPDTLSPRYREYARRNAAIGINGTVLNNVNAAPQILSGEYIPKVEAIANVLRPYGIKVYLSINFSSPMVLGGLKTADPLNAEVAAWWKEKVREIYDVIPDFGGFLVKANSEGLPGPQDFGRSHADGANMLAKALKPFGGIVMWRSFVYKPDGDDRAKQAYLEFVPLDGQFENNVILQVKNGPVDFQPREPFNPLFGAMKQTSIMAEFQITQEYLGFSNHLVYLAPLWKECLDSDTYLDGEHCSVKQITCGNPISAIAGVANIGEDANWCGHPFAAANWYAFGRLAWNPSLSANAVAEEWLLQTFPEKGFAKVLPAVKEMMLESREVAVDYMMPLGLHHLFAWGHHYGPEPWCEVEGARPDWLPKYYHRADSIGLGFDRTATGSNAVAQYNPPLGAIFGDIRSCPENLLLWFHHVPWTYQMKNGATLWENLCHKYEYGIGRVRNFGRIWEGCKPYVDPETFRMVEERLKIQEHDAVWWKNGCLLYFQTFSKLDFPNDIEPMTYTLDELKSIKLDLKHHN